MPRTATSLDEKQERFAKAEQGLKQMKELIESTPDGAEDYKVMFEMVQKEYDNAKTGIDNATSAGFREADDSFLDEFFKPLIWPLIDDVLSELETSTDDTMGEGFYESRVVGRDVIIRFSIGDNEKTRGLQLVNPREASHRAFRVTSFSGSIPQAIAEAIDNVKGKSLQTVVWKNKSAFIRTLCTNSRATDENGNEVVFLNYSGIKVRTVQEMLKQLETNHALILDHDEVDTLLALTETKEPIG